MTLHQFTKTIALVAMAAAGQVSTVFGQLTAPLGSQATPSTASVPHTLTLEEAIQQALSRNYTIRTAANTTRRNQIEVTRSKDNMWLPTVTASGQWRYNYSLAPQTARSFGADTLLGVVAQPLPSGSHSLSYGASANLSLYNGGSDLAHVHSAEASLDAAQNTSFWTRQQIASDVTTAFVTVLRTRELVDAAQQTLGEALAQLDLVRGKYQAGVVPIGQVYQQEAVVGQDSVNLIQARNDFENAKADALFLVNVPPNEYHAYSFSLSGIDTSTSLAARIAIDTSISVERINAVIDKRPDILARRQSIEALVYDIDITRGALLPHLGASAGIAGSGADADLGKVRLEHSLNAGLSLTIPIFDAMQSRLLIQEQEVDLETQKIQLEQDVQKLRSDAAKAVNNLRSAGEALDATDAGLRSAEESLRLAGERLRVGAGTQVDVVIAEAAVTNARANRVNAKYNWVLAQRQLAYTLGQWNY